MITLFFSPKQHPPKHMQNSVSIASSKRFCGNYCFGFISIIMTVRNLNFPLRNVQLSLHYRHIFILMKMSPLFILFNNEAKIFQSSIISNQIIFAIPGKKSASYRKFRNQILVIKDVIKYDFIKAVASL